MNNNYSLDILVLAPHPDDAEICCGGTIAKATKLGQKVAICDFTRGELGTRGSVETRAKEAELASKILGISKRINLELPDGYIGLETEAMSVHTQIRKIVTCIRKEKPMLVFLPYEFEGRHPDHAAASNLAAKACFYAQLKNFEPELGAPHTVKQMLYYQMRFAFSPSFITDISDLQETKYNAISAYGSQVTFDKGNPTLVSSPLSVGSMKARDAYYGGMIGTEAGEPFLMKNAVAVDDPVSFFRKQNADAVLIYPEKP